jgi:small-conductance mechanosensitive channel
MLQDTGDALLLAFSDALRTFFAFIPRLIGAIVVLLVGLFLGRLVATLVTKGLRMVRFDQIADRAEIDDFLRDAGVRMDPAAVVGELAKWFVYIVFFQIAASTLGIPELTAILNQILAFIPRVIVALAILLIGALAANFLSGLVRGSVGSARVGNANLLASIVRWGVLAFAVVAALSQLEVAPDIVNTLWTALIGGLGLALAIAFGFGARDAAASVATGQMIKGDFKPGMEIRVDGEAGTVEEIGALYTTLRTGDGFLKIPNAELVRKTVEVGAPRR